MQKIWLLGRRLTKEPRWGKIWEEEGHVRHPWRKSENERAISRRASGAFVRLKVFLLPALAAHLNVLFLRPSEHYQTVII